MLGGKRILDALGLLSSVNSVNEEWKVLGDRMRIFFDSPNGREISVLVKDASHPMAYINGLHQQAVGGRVGGESFSLLPIHWSTHPAHRGTMALADVIGKGSLSYLSLLC